MHKELGTVSAIQKAEIVRVDRANLTFIHMQN